MIGFLRRTAFLPILLLAASLWSGCWEDDEPALPQVPPAPGVPGGGAIEVPLSAQAGGSDDPSGGLDRPARYWLDRANLERAHGFHDAALGFYDLASRRADAALKPSVLFQKGSCLRDMERFEAAEAILTECLEFSDGELRRRSQHLLAEVRERLGRPQDALGLRREVLVQGAAVSERGSPAPQELRAYEDLVRQGGDVAAEIEVWEKLVQEPARKRYARQVLVMLYGLQDPQRSAKLMEAMIVEAKDDLALRDRYVNLLRKSGLLEQAEAALRQMAEDFPGRRENAMEQIVAVRLERNDVAGATQILEELSKAADKPSSSWLQTGSLWLRLQRPDRAEECYRRAVESTKKPSERQQVELLLGKLLMRQSKFDEAEAILNTIIAAPASPDIEAEAESDLKMLRALRKK